MSAPTSRDARNSALMHLASGNLGCLVRQRDLTRAERVVIDSLVEDGLARRAGAASLRLDTAYVLTKLGATRAREIDRRSEKVAALKAALREALAGVGDQAALCDVWTLLDAVDVDTAGRCVSEAVWARAEAIREASRTGRRLRAVDAGD